MSTVMRRCMRATNLLGLRNIGWLGRVVAEETGVDFSGIVSQGVAGFVSNGGSACVPPGARGLRAVRRLV